MKNREALIAELKSLRTPSIAWNKETREYDDIEVSPAVIERGTEILVSAEGGDAQLWADYYGEFRGGYPYINQALESFAKKHGMYWEWENPGAIYLCA